MSVNQKDQEDYYPVEVDSEKTQKKINSQRNVIRKVIHSLEWREKVPSDIFQLIACFCFSSPIVFRIPIYVPLQQPQFNSQQHLICHKNKKARLAFQILGSWEGGQGVSSNVMVLADHFCKVMALQNMEIADVHDSRKWNIVGKKGYLFKTAFQQISDYQRRGKFHLSILDSFTTLMSSSILKFQLNGVKYIYFYKPTQISSQISMYQDLNASFSCFDAKWKIKLSNPSYSVYEKTTKIKKRGEQTIFGCSFQQVQLNDIYFKK